MGKKNKDKLQAEIDNGVYGQRIQYDKNFYGPRAKRSCTDIICLMIFVCFLVAWIIVGSIAFSQGTPLKLVAPYDSINNQCGVDPGFEDRKYIFYFDLTKCTKASGGSVTCNTPQVCVESCPNNVFHGETDRLGLNNVEKAICKYGIEPKQDELSEYIRNDICAPWYLPTKSMARRCVIVNFDDINAEVNETIGPMIKWDDLKEGSKAAQILAQTKKVGATIVSELGKNWPYLLGGFAIAMAFCMIYILIMRWFAGIIVWFSIFAVVGLFAYCIYASWVNYVDVKNSSEKFDIRDGVDSLFTLELTWIIFFIASIIVLVIILLMILFLRNRIRIAIALVGEGSRAVGSATSTLFFPLAPWVIQLGIIAWTIAVWIFLASSTVPVFRITNMDEGCCPTELFADGDRCEPNVLENSPCKECGSCTFQEFEDRAYVGWFHAVNIIGFFWVLCFVSAFSDMALAGTFSTWYWTFNKADVPYFNLSRSVGRNFRYHLGTLSFGALILALCRLIRVVLEGINNTLNKYSNPVTKCVLCCMTCFFWCLENFIKFINRNAYIMCAIHGKNFCNSARRAFNLLMRNILRVYVIDKVTDFLFLLGKLTITSAMVILSINIFKTKIDLDNDDEVPEYTYYLLPVIIVGIGTYFVASIFFSVYAMAVDTLFLCFLEDLERNDGSTEKPYYMSKSLMKVLGKKNKKYKERLE